MLLFVVAIVFEVAFTVYCITTGFYHPKIRGIFRIGALIGFILLLILNVLEWSFRYYALAALLIVLAVLGLTAVIRWNANVKAKAKAFKAGRVILKAAVLTMLAAAAILPAVIFPPYKPLDSTGEYQTAIVNYLYEDMGRKETYTDAGENRTLNVDFYYPEKSEGKHPLIVFSHGAFGTKSSNESLYLELASHGYVVCTIDHTYQCLYTKDRNGNMIWMDKGYMQEISAEDAKSDRLQSYEYYQKWMKVRTDDIQFVIGEILEKANSSNVETVYRLVDTTKIGVMGHSLGGAAALGIGRMMDEVGAVAALEAPYMCDIEGVRDGEFVFTEEKYPVPVLNLYTDSSWGHLAEWPQYAQNNMMLFKADEGVHNVHMQGAWHLSITDLSLVSPFLTRVLDGHKATIDAEYCLRTIDRTTLEFFDCYLKQKGEFTLNSSVYR